MSFDTTVVSRVQKVGSIVPLESRIYAVWFLNIEGGNILYNSEFSLIYMRPSYLELKLNYRKKVFYFALNFLPWEFLLIKKLDFEKTKTT